MYWLSIPFLAYILMVPVAAAIETIGGRGTVGPDVLDEYLIIVQLLIFFGIFRMIRNMGFTKDDQ